MPVAAPCSSTCRIVAALVDDEVLGRCPAVQAGDGDGAPRVVGDAPGDLGADIVLHDADDRILRARARAEIEVGGRIAADGQGGPRDENGGCAHGEGHKSGCELSLEWFLLGKEQALDGPTPASVLTVRRIRGRHDGQAASIVDGPLVFPIGPQRPVVSGSLHVLPSPRPSGTARTAIRIPAPPRSIAPAAEAGVSPRPFAAPPPCGVAHHGGCCACRARPRDSG